MLEKYYSNQLKTQEVEFQESTTKLKQFWTETQQQQEEELQLAQKKINKQANQLKNLEKVPCFRSKIKKEKIRGSEPKSI